MDKKVNQKIQIELSNNKKIQLPIIELFLENRYNLVRIKHEINILEPIN